jgi:predicted RNA-binding protein with RPS1 domain
VRVKVLAVDVSRNRIGLSVRRAEGAPLPDTPHRSKAAKRPPDRGKPAGGGVADALRRASHDKGR